MYKRREFLKNVGMASVLSLLSLPVSGVRAGSPPKAEKAEEVIHAKKIPTICTFCAVGCGITATVANGEVIDVEGDPYNPNNSGTLCPKGRASLQLIVNPTRLEYPLKRTNPKKGIDEDPGWVRFSWEEALDLIASWVSETISGEVTRLKGKGILTPQPTRADEKYYFDGHEHPVGIIGSAVYNNEEAFLHSKLWAILGSNNIDHCARKCHGTTVAALANTFGFGAMTNHFLDMQYPRVIIHEGGNPASAHPVAYRWLRKAKDKGAKIIVIDPVFSRSGTQADIYGRVRVGTDTAVFLGITKYAIDHGLHDEAFLRENTNAPCLLRVDKFHHELYKVESTADIDYTSSENLWKGVETYSVLTTKGEIKPWVEVPPEERVLVGEKDGLGGEKLQTVFKVLKTVLGNYTADEVSRITGLSVKKFNEIASTFTSLKPGTVTYAMGLTQHTNAAQLLRSLCIMQLVLGNMGKPGGGINAIRGQNNVQGATDMCVLAHILPGYIPPPNKDAEIREHQAWKNAGMPGDLSRKIAPRVDFTWKGVAYKKGVEYDNIWYMKTLTTRKFKGWRRYERAWGMFVGTWPTDDPENGAIISDLPYKIGHPIIDQDRAYGHGKIKTYFVWGDNSVVTDGGAASVYKEFCEAPGKLVVADIHPTETAHLADVVLPMVSVYERNGSASNSARWVQYRWKVRDPPGEAKPDIWLTVKLYKVLRERDAIRLPSERFMKDHPGEPFPTDDLGRKCLEYIPGDEIWGVGKAGRPCPDSSWNWYADPHTENMKASDQVYAEIDDAVGLYDGQYRHPGYKFAVHAYMDNVGEILAKRRETTLRSGIDSDWTMMKSWAWCWPKNVRVLYNREDCGELDDFSPATFKTSGNAPWGRSLGYPLSRVKSFPFWERGNTFYWGKDRSGLACVWSHGLAKLGKDLTAAYDAWTGPKPTVPGETFRGRRLKGPGGKPVVGIPEHHEPMESPDAELSKDYPCYGWLYVNRDSEYEGNDKLWDWGRVGTPEEGYNVIWGSFRLTEHFHSFTRNMRYLNETQPELFAEICPEHAAKIGVKSGDYVKVESKRGWIITRVRLTERVGKLHINGKDHYEIMMPFHFGFKGFAKGSIANFVSIGAVDTHGKTPETKAALCRVVKASDEEVRMMKEYGFCMGGKV